jgi:hypothetical protein
VHGGIAVTIAGAADGKAGVLTFKPDMLDVQSGQTANIGITVGQTSRTDPRIELLPTSLTVQNGGTASLVAGAGYTQPAGGSINVAGGRLNVNQDLFIPTGATLRFASGTLNVAGSTTLSINGGVGSFSQTFEVSNLGALQVTGGGDLVSTSSVDIANTTSSGQLLVSGAGSTLSAPSSNWGASPGSAATVTFASSGAGTLEALTLSGQGGSSTLLLQSGGRLTTTAGLRAGPNAGTGSTTINIFGGTLSNLGTADFRGGTSVNLSSGGLILANGGTFSQGSTLNWTGGTVNLAAGRTLAFDGGVGSTSLGDVSMPDASTLRITNGGRFDAAGVFNIAGPAGPTGTLLVDGANSRFTTGPSFQFWANGSGTTATITFSNLGAGTLDRLALATSSGAQGLLNILSGASVFANNLVVGSGSGGAPVNLDGTLNVGSMSLSNALTVLSFNSGSFNSTATFSIGASARMLFSAGRNKVARVGALSFSSAGRMDLSDNALIVDYTGPTPFSLIRNYIIAGRNGGNWLGDQLTSSAAAANANMALGIVEASSIGSPATFFGQPIDSTTLLIAYTFAGDTNLDGKVNTIDFNNLSGNFGGSGKVWLNGDFDYDGLVSSTDFNLLAGNFGRILAPVASLPGPQLGSIVPEPAIAIIAFPAVALATRQRRRFGRDPVNGRA